MLGHFSLITTYLITHGLFLREKLHNLLRHFKKERSVFENKVSSVAYPGILFGGGGVQQIQLRTGDRKNGDLGAVDP